jgi:ribosomal protein L12E/L44/L45/RPP1/RPP2
VYAIKAGLRTAEEKILANARLTVSGAQKAANEEKQKKKRGREEEVEEEEEEEEEEVPDKKKGKERAIADEGRSNIPSASPFDT